MLNDIELEFLKQLNIHQKGNIFIKDGEVLSYFGSCNLPRRKITELTDFKDGLANTRVYCKDKCVLNIASLEKEKESLKAVRVVNKNMLFSLKETFIKGKLTEITISSGKYDGMDETIIKMQLKDKYHKDVFLKAYIMRLTSKNTYPCYIECNDKNVKAYDCGDPTGVYLQEPVVDLFHTTSRDFATLLEEILKYRCLTTDGSKEFFLKIMPVFTLIYDIARNNFKEADKPQIEVHDVVQARHSIVSVGGKRNGKIKTEAKLRLDDDGLSSVEKRALYDQYMNLQEQLDQEMQVDIHTVFELNPDETNTRQK